MYAARTKKACNWPGNSLTLTKPPVWVKTQASAIRLTVRSLVPFLELRR